MSEPVMPQEELSQSAPVTPRPRRVHKKRAPVFLYLTILFAAAFLLLMLSYFMQQRTMAESLAGLKDSVSSMEKVQGLQTENTALKGQLNTLTEENAALAAELAALKSEREQLAGELAAAQNAVDAQSRTAEAMDWFWQINEAYVRGRYSLARELMEQMDDTLVEFLPKENTTGTNRFSPAERYQELYDALY